MIVQALILKDADTDAKMNNGETPLQIAENQKNSDIMDLLETDDRPKKFSLTNHTVAFRVNNRTLLGEGAHGKVVRGYLTSHATGHVFTVAVKSMKPDDELPFRNEIKFLTTCTHENIVRFYGAKASPSRLYIVMECCDGGTLWDYVHSHENSLDANTLLLWMYQCARGLEFLHDKGKIHRDIDSKPSAVQGNDQNQRLWYRQVFTRCALTRSSNNTPLETSWDTGLFSSRTR